MDGVRTFLNSIAWQLWEWSVIYSFSGYVCAAAYRQLRTLAARCDCYLVTKAQILFQPGIKILRIADPAVKESTMRETDTKYPNLRQTLNANLAARSDEAIETALERAGLDAEAAEGFFDQLGKIASSVGQVALKAAPSILPVAGTVLGGAFGGPIGASLGSSLGSLAGKAIGGATGQPSAPQAGGGGGGLLGSLGGVLGGLTGGGSPAAGQFLQALGGPTLQAVASMALGPQLGKSDVNVGGASVPTGTFARMLSMLAGRMENEYHESLAASREAVPEYMMDFAGQPKGDPTVADHRAAALFELLQSSDSRDESADEGWDENQEMAAMQAEFDAMELMELYGAEEA
jgi:hypothetical protein